MWAAGREAEEERRRQEVCLISSRLEALLDVLDDALLGGEGLGPVLPPCLLGVDEGAGDLDFEVAGDAGVADLGDLDLVPQLLLNLLPELGGVGLVASAPAVLDRHGRRHLKVFLASDERNSSHESLLCLFLLG
eukprot:CAMPEP_0118919568 /NCGR_PEP_ID=MMETSP1166-20130328/18626_1 /TAXON_ID=1104430 /ORGANISM="Chrysoreinhardia sp, Strain CCMP3193" /LENGTH=133 /DNA_ID=CAMNT_0006860099 /DNA_START=156 /DNA_END=554 /DNA_ORIENTATION=-